MSEIIEQSPVGETQQPVAETPDASAQLELVKAKNQELLREKQAVKKQMEDMQRQMADLQTNQQKVKQSQLAEAGEFKQLWQEQSGTVTSLQDEIVNLKSQLEAKDVAAQQAQIKATAINAFTQNGVNAPDVMLKVLQDSLRVDENGAVIALVGGVQVDLNTHLNNLKQPGSGMDMLFSGSQARGMSAAGSTPSSSGGKSWGSMSFTEKLQMEVDNPQRAEQLKAQG
jgi:myosin heavy subunit